MAVITPFKPIVRKPELAAKVASLPYDVMNSDEARDMAKDNPYSFLHIVKAEIDLDPSIDLYDKCVYEKARDNLNKLIADGVGARRKTPTLHLQRGDAGPDPRLAW